MTKKYSAKQFINNIKHILEFGTLGLIKVYDKAIIVVLCFFSEREHAASRSSVQWSQ